MDENAKPNREQRRHPEQDSGSGPPEHPQSTQHDLAKAGGQDEQAVRAKASGHKKKTADKWNQ